MDNIEKNCNNMENLDEIEQTKLIDYESYNDHPEDLIKIAYQTANKQNFDEAIEIIDNAIELKLKTFNKEDLELARFYIVNADIIIRKITESQELFNNKPAKKDDDSENCEEEEEEMTDEEIVLDNLMAAEKIYLSNIEKEGIPLKLGDVYSLFGELWMCRDDYKEAIKKFTTALDYYHKHDELMSRNKADVYFKMGLCFDFDPYKNFLCMFFPKIIIEYHLQKKLDECKNIYMKNFLIHDEENEKYIKENSLDIKIDVNSVQIKNIDDDDKDSEEIKELKSILKEIYIKVNF